MGGYRKIDGMVNVTPVLTWLPQSYKAEVFMLVDQANPEVMGLFVFEVGTHVPLGTVKGKLNGDVDEWTATLADVSDHEVCDDITMAMFWLLNTCKYQRKA